MTRFSKKCVWIIVLAVFAIAAVIFLGWGSKGFRYWDTSEWFNRWGKGKPSVVRVAEPPAEQHAMALMSANSEVETYSAASDFEVILDSADGITTVSTVKLSAPQLSVSSDGKNLNIQVTGTLCKVTLFVVPFGNEYSDSDTFSTLTSSQFTGSTNHTCSIPLSQLYTGVRTIIAKSKYFSNSHDLGNSFGLFAQHETTNSNYLSSDNSNILYFQPHAKALSSEYTDSKFELKCTNVFDVSSNYKSAPFEFNVRTGLSSDANSLIAFTSEMSGTGGLWATYYTGGYYGVDLLTLADKLAEKPASEIYYFVFSYKAFSYTYNSKTYTIEPLIANRTLTSSFIINRLATPSNFVFDDGTLTWDPIEGATQYGVFWTEGDEEKQAFVDTPSYTFDVQALGEGEHTVRVRALGNMAQTAVDNGETASITAYNASNVITQVVSLTYDVDGDTVTKFVPVGSLLSEYTYEVKVRGKEFGGWFYDSGFSRAVNDTDTVSKDMTIYARLSDKKVVERKATWWDEYKWYVIGGIIGLVCIGVIVAVVVGIRKRKAA